MATFKELILNSYGKENAELLDRIPLNEWDELSNMLEIRTDGGVLSPDYEFVANVFIKSIEIYKLLKPDCKDKCCKYYE